MEPTPRLALALLLALSTLACASTNEEADASDAPGAPGAPRAPAASAPDALAGARELDRRFADAFTRGDVDAIMACYWNDPGVLMQPPNLPELRGWEAIRDNYRAHFEAMPGLHLAFEDRVDRQEGPVVVSAGRWRLSDGPGEGANVVLRGRFLDVKGLRDGKWVYLADVVSAMPE